MATQNNEDILKQDLLDIMTEFVEKIAKESNKYTTDKAIIKVNDELSVSLFTPSHLQFAKYGRGPGKNPPLDPLEAWIKREGIVSSPDEVRSTAFAIQASIAKRGTLNWKPGAPNALEEMLDESVLDHASELASQIGLNINLIVKKAWEAVLPESITLPM